MAITQSQMSAIATQLAVDLSVLSNDRLVELCLLHRAAPNALPSFVAALDTELVRRFTTKHIAANDVIFAVLQNFANNFASLIPYFQLQMIQMAASVNRDIWFQNNAGMFTTSINDNDVMAWLITQPDILTKCLNNSFGLTMIAQSTTAATAILTHEPSLGLWMQSNNLWTIWPDCQAGMAVLAKSSELMSYVAASTTALNAVAASSTAMTAVAASTTAMDVLYNNYGAFYVLLVNHNSLAALAKSRIALPYIIHHPGAPAWIQVDNNSSFQAVRNEIFNTIKQSWTMSRRQAFLQTNFSNAEAAFATPAGFVVAYLGKYDTAGHGTFSLIHPHHGNEADQGSIRDMKNTVFTIASPIDAISFNGASLKHIAGSAPRAVLELWTPPA